MSEQASVTIRPSLKGSVGCSLHSGPGPAHRSEEGYICLVTIFPPHFPGLQDRRRDHSLNSMEGKEKIWFLECLPDV